MLKHDIGRRNIDFVHHATTSWLQMHAIARAMAVLLARLAVDLQHQRRRLGQALL